MEVQDPLLPPNWARRSCARPGCTETFDVKKDSPRKTCSQSCMQKLSHASGRRKRSRQIDIPDHELKRLAEVEGMMVPEIALHFGVTPSTIHRKLSKIYPRGRERWGVGSFLRNYKAIYVPKDKVSFLLKVDYDRAADAEVLLKGVVQEFRLNGKAGFTTIDPRITHAQASGYIAELDRRNEFSAPKMKTPHYASRVWSNSSTTPGSPQLMLLH